MKNLSLHLVPLDVTHSPILFDLTDRNRDHLRAWLPWVDHIRALQDTQGFVENALSKTASGVESHYIMMADDQPLGIIGLIDIKDGSGSVGYWIDRAHGRRGLTSAALEQLKTIAFNELGLNRLRLEYLEGNEASARVAARCGFRCVQTIPKATTLHGVALDRFVCLHERPAT